jgi:predicted DNA-binding transcriptional regulator AlpA
MSASRRCCTDRSADASERCNRGAQIFHLDADDRLAMRWSDDGRDYTRRYRNRSDMAGKRILRKREVLERLGIRKTTLYETFIKTGRLRFVKIGARAVGIIEDELDALIEELRRERDRSPRAARERGDANADDMVLS